MKIHGFTPLCFLSSATDSSPTIGVTENHQKVSTPSCVDSGCDPERIISWMEEHGNDLTPSHDQDAIVVAIPLWDILSSTDETSKSKEAHNSCRKYLFNAHLMHTPVSFLAEWAQSSPPHNTIVLTSKEGDVPLRFLRPLIITSS